MATVEVTFTPLPAHVRTARLVATAVARRSGVDEALLDEVRLAVGEACSRAVEAHRRHCPAEPVKIEMTDQGERFVVVVSDHAPAGNATLHGATTGANGHGVADLGPGRGRRRDPGRLRPGRDLGPSRRRARLVDQLRRERPDELAVGRRGRLSQPRASPFIKHACRARHGHGTHCVSAAANRYTVMSWR